VEVIERLIGKGYELRLYDHNVRMASLVGANRDYILNRIPHISRLMVADVDEVLDFAETILVGNGDPQFAEIFDRLRPGQSVIDFVRVAQARKEAVAYEGICW
jgi:GDP-mannose 6-dehydrogenase